MEHLEIWPAGVNPNLMTVMIQQTTDVFKEKDTAPEGTPTPRVHLEGLLQNGTIDPDEICVACHRNEGDYTLKVATTYVRVRNMDFGCQAVEHHNGEAEFRHFPITATGALGEVPPFHHEDNYNDGIQVEGSGQ